MKQPENKVPECTDDTGSKTAIATEHLRCFACGPQNHNGLRLNFALLPEGGVQAVFPCSDCYCGYDGILHGGVISTLLDAAMTNCLFAEGIVAVTVEIKVQFRHPVILNLPAIVSACRERSFSVFHFTRGQLLQNNKIVARATGRFVSRKKRPPATPVA